MCLAVVTAAECGPLISASDSKDRFPQCNAKPWDNNCGDSDGTVCKAECIDGYEGGYNATCDTGIWFFDGCCSPGNAVTSIFNQV